MNGDYNLDNAFKNATQAVKFVPLAANTATPLLSRSRNRIAVHFYAPNASIVNILTSPMTAVNQGAGVSSANSLSITQRSHGDLATEEWHAFAAASPGVWVVEVFACPCATGH